MLLKSGDDPDIAHKAPTMLSKVPLSLREVHFDLRRNSFAEGSSLRGRSQRTTPHFPLHPRCRSIHTSLYSSVIRLRLSNILFANFADFSNLLVCFVNLEELRCTNISLAVFGLIPGYASKAQVARRGQKLLCSLRTLTVCRYMRSFDFLISYSPCAFCMV